MDIELLQRANNVQNQIFELRMRQQDIEKFDPENFICFEAVIRQAIDLRLLDARELADKVNAEIKDRLEALTDEFESL